MKKQKFWRAVIYPHLAFALSITLVATCLLIYSLTNLEGSDIFSIVSYALSTYALVVWCFRVPSLVRWILQVKANNRYARRWFSDPRLRTNVTLTGNVLWNVAYATLQLVLGLHYRSMWFWSTATYYYCLGAMRLMLLRYTACNKPGANMSKELKYYRACGWIFVPLNLALSAMMFFLIRQNRGAERSMVVAIAMATYTFASLAFAIIGAKRYRKYHSPVLSASRAISLTAASVSMLTLEASMLNTFGTEEMNENTRTLLLTFSGGAVAVIIMIMAVYMILRANRKLKELECSNGTE